jgi:hypothetical protein
LKDPCIYGIDDLHLDIKREGIYTGILQPVKVFYMLVGIGDLHLDIKREGCRSPMPTNL